MQPANSKAPRRGSGSGFTPVVTIPGGDAGLVQTTTDPRDVVSVSDYDMLGQTVATISGFTNGVPTSSSNQTTEFTYDGDGDETSQTALMPAGTSSQTTDWIFDATISGGSAIDANNLLTKVEYPDLTTGVTGQARGLIRRIQVAAASCR